MAKVLMGGGRPVANTSSSSGGVRFWRLGGDSAVDATVAVVGTTWRAGSGKISRLMINISINTRTTTTTFEFYKNGAPGTQTFTVGAGLTGWFGDVSTGFDTIADDDVIALRSTNGAAATGSFTIFAVAYVFEADVGTRGMQLWSSNNVSNVPGGSGVGGVNGWLGGCGGASSAHRWRARRLFSPSRRVGK